MERGGVPNVDGGGHEKATDHARATWKRCRGGRTPCADMRKTEFDASRGIYPPSEDTFLLVDAVWEQKAEWMKEKRASVVVEVGTGSGYVLASVAAMARETGQKMPVLVACDVAKNACSATLETASKHGCEGRMVVVQDDLARGMRRRLEEKFKADLLLCNPPYVPTEEEEADRDDIARAWAGGKRGRRVIDPFVKRAKNMLDAGGIALLVALEQNDPKDICETFQRNGMNASIVKTITADEEKLCVIMARKKYA